MQRIPVKVFDSFTKDEIDKGDKRSRFTPSSSSDSCDSSVSFRGSGGVKITKKSSIHREQESSNKIKIQRRPALLLRENFRSDEASHQEVQLSIS